MVRFQAPASVFLRRAQLIFMLAALLPTILMTLLGIILLARGSQALNIVAGVLVVTFCTSAVTAYILGSIFISRGASLARIQHHFLSSVSHELRTPLTSMRMFVETLRANRVNEEEREKCLDILHHEMGRLDELVSRLIELSRIRNEAHAFERKPVRGEDVVSDAMGAFRAYTLPHEVPVKLHVEPGVVVSGDRNALGRAVGNLLINAYKHNPGADRFVALTVRTMDRKHVVFSVEDNGPGIPLAERKNVFEPFFRGTDSVAKGIRGSGLGLSIVRAVVEAHRGKVDVQGTDSGAEFRVILPRPKHDARRDPDRRG